MEGSRRHSSQRLLRYMHVKMHLSTEVSHWASGEECLSTGKGYRLAGEKGKNSVRERKRMGRGPHSLSLKPCKLIEGARARHFCIACMRKQLTFPAPAVVLATAAGKSKCFLRS